LKSGIPIWILALMTRKKVFNRLDTILRSSPVFDTLRRSGDEECQMRNAEFGLRNVKAIKGIREMGRWSDREIARGGDRETQNQMLIVFLKSAIFLIRNNGN
jgi:hypothetical protein